jgi:hypothetical protein
VWEINDVFRVLPVGVNDSVVGLLSSPDRHVVFPASKLHLQKRYKKKKLHLLWKL